MNEQVNERKNKLCLVFYVVVSSPVPVFSSNHLIVHAEKKEKAGG